LYPSAGEKEKVYVGWTMTSKIRGLDDDVEIVLELVRYPEVPHRQGEEVLVGALEPVDDLLHGLPGLLLLRGMLLPVEDDVLGVDHLSVEGRKVRLPEVQGIDRVIGMRFLVFIDERARNFDGCRPVLPGRCLDVEQTGHDAPPFPPFTATLSTMMQSSSRGIRSRDGLRHILSGPARTPYRKQCTR
jgi:hypothetical protein